MKIHYVTGLDGWGDGAPTDDEQESFRAYVVHRLVQVYPGADVTAEVDPRALDSRVAVDVDSLDPAEVRSFVGNEIWSEWCGGARAPS